MRISRQLVTRPLALAALVCATAALAQDHGRERIAQEGAVAADRLKAALEGAKASDTPDPSPVLPAPAGPAEMRRVLEALRDRLRDSNLEARAKTAEQAGEAGLARERDAQALAIRQALGLEPGDGAALSKAAPSQLPGWVPVLFVSSSMPIAVLRSYAVQLEKAHGVFAFRGMPGGLHKVGPMAKLSAQILRIDPGCDGPACAMRDVQLIVDPILFRQHGVAQVPALGLVPGDPAQPYCEREADSKRAAYLVFGDSALSGMLDEYARLGGAEEVRDARARLASR